MTDTKKGNISARILIIALAVALAVMLGASLKARFQNPHLTVAARQQQGMGGGEAGEDAQTVGKLMRQVAENPQDLGALIHLIEHLVTAQNWDAAETFAQRAVTMDVSNPKPLYLLGVIQHNQGRHKEAAEALEQVVKIKDEASVRYSLGVLYIYFLEDPKHGAEHLRAGLTDATASEELKAAIKQELEKVPAVEEAQPAAVKPDAKADAKADKKADKKTDKKAAK